MPAGPLSEMQTLKTIIIDIEANEDSALADLSPKIVARLLTLLGATDQLVVKIHLEMARMMGAVERQSAAALKLLMSTRITGQIMKKPSDTRTAAMMTCP